MKKNQTICYYMQLAFFMCNVKVKCWKNITNVVVQDLILCEILTFYSQRAEKWTF